jgi:small subunit ribosomal protein S9
MALKLSKKPNNVKKVIKKVTKKTSVANQRNAGGRAVGRESAPVTMPTGKYVEGIGRRKVATARVYIYEQGGDIVVNNQIAGEYFSNIAGAAKRYMEPFELTGTKGTFGVSAKISGSGIEAQLDALVHGISRALIEFNPDFRPLLKPAGLLTRDSRMKETRKIGHGGKARAKRQSPKR